MDSILEYIIKYGKYDFEARPFNEVDGLVLSQFSYLKFDEMVPEVGTYGVAVRLKDLLAHSKYEQLYSDDRYAKPNRELFEVMANSRRYGRIKLNHYINLHSRRWEMQFSAITCYLPNALPVIAYRGTDESIVGWKEDFNMAFMTPIPSQLKAIDYLNYVSERIRGDFNIVGHSKGGNLAVYAAMKCSDITALRIERVYSYDGPGFTKEALGDGDYCRIKDKINKYVPKSSVVGMLLQSQEEYKVVYCRKFGLLQHNPFNWVVDFNKFVYVDGIGNMTAIHDKSINEWAQSTDEEEMRQFVGQMFDVLDAVGIDDLNDFKGNYPEIIKRFTVAIDGLDDKQKELMKSIFANLIDIFIETVKEQSGISMLGEQDKKHRRNI